MHETFWEEGTSVFASCPGYARMLSWEVGADVFPGEMLQRGQG